MSTVLCACIKDKELYCKNWDGKGGTMIAEMNLVCPSEVPCPYEVVPTKSDVLDRLSGVTPKRRRRGR